MSEPLSPEVQKWLADANKAAFLLDFDGTMVHLADRPDQVIVPRRLIENLKVISQNPQLSFAIVTGRALAALDVLMDGMTTIAVGSHGAEWRSAPGAAIQIIAAPMPLALRQALSAVAQRHDCIFEDKVYTISLHLPFAQMDQDLTPELSAALGNYLDDYDVRAIGRTYEVLQKHVNKGSGIRHLLQQPAFTGKWPVYIGDDASTDASLEVVDAFNGIRLGVSNHAAHEQPRYKDYMGIDSVNWIVQLLADYTAVS